MPQLGTVGKIYHRGNDEFDWKVGNFLSLSHEPDSSYKSPVFHFKDYCCSVMLYPGGDFDSGGDHVSLELYLSRSEVGEGIQCSTGIKTARGETVMSFSDTMLRRTTYQFFNDSRWILRSELLRRRDELLPLGELTIAVSLKEIADFDVLFFKDVSVQTGVAENLSDACGQSVEDDGEHGVVEKAGFKDASVQTAVGENLADASVQTTAEDGEHGLEGKAGFKDASVQTAVGENLADASVQTTAEDGEHGLEEKSGGEKVLQDIGKLWTSGEDSDVVMKVRGVEFKAHRTILRMRAPVLGAMFQHDTTEKASGEVIIEDCEPAVFEQLLHYIYTGAPRELKSENAAALYAVADKYLVNEVKALCLQCMKDTVCVDNFCDVVTISLLHNEEELLSVAISFLSEHTLDVMQTVEWQVFLREHATWANEILIRTLKIQANNKEVK